MENLLSIETNKANFKMNKPLYLTLSIPDINKIAMYEYQYDYSKPNDGDRC